MNPGILREPPPARPEAAVDTYEAPERDDDAIRTDVWTLVSNLISVADLGLTVEKGAVRIRGRALRKSHADSIRALIAAIPGVVSVCGEIECTESPAGGGRPPPPVAPEPAPALR
jgi:hypothetical protein